MARTNLPLGIDGLVLREKIVQGAIPRLIFGENPSSTEDIKETVWDEGGIYPYPSTADITHIYQAVDQVAMRGKKIHIHGTDINFNDVYQDVFMDATNTTTLVALGTPLFRVSEAIVHDDVVGDQDIIITNVGSTTIYARMRAGHNTTMNGIETVPAGYDGYISSFQGSVTNTATLNPENSHFELWARNREFGHEFHVIHSWSIPKLGDGFQHDFKPWFRVAEKTDIMITATCLDRAGSVTAGVDLLLIPAT